jgi:pyruvate/2-oxoglutarate dehydrogenase complex dihydrolipoamide dehydrogenase (E3) component
MGARAEVDVGAALAGRHVTVSDYSDASQERWVAGRGIDLLRDWGQVAGTRALVNAVCHTAEHVVVATGSDPIAGLLTEVESVWHTPDRQACRHSPGASLELCISARALAATATISAATSERTTRPVEPAR